MSPFGHLHEAKITLPTTNPLSILILQSSRTKRIKCSIAIIFVAMNVLMRGPLRIAVTAVPGMPSSWRDCNGLLTTEAIHISLDSSRRSSVTVLTHSASADLNFPLIIPIKDLQSVEEIPMSIATRGRHALCVKYQNTQGICENHFSFSSESQYSSWQTSLDAAIAECRATVIIETEFDYFAPPPVHVALPAPPPAPSPPQHLSNFCASDHVELPHLLSGSNILHSSSISSSNRSENFEHFTHTAQHEDPSRSISLIQAYVRLALHTFKYTPSNQFSSPNHHHLLRTSLNSSSRVIDSRLQSSDSSDNYPTIMPLMNVLLSVEERTATPSSRNHPASVAVNLLRLNAKAAVAASVETKFETDTLVSSLKQSIHHLQTSKDDLCQEFEDFKDACRQSSSSLQVLVDRREEEIGSLNTKLRQICRACGLETDDSAQIIEAISNLQEKLMLQNNSTFILQSELEFSRQNGIRAAILHASLVETKDSEIRNLTHALQTKDSEIENLVACLQTQADKIKDFELANSLIREDATRHQTEADMRFSMHQHNSDLKIQALSSERDALSVANGNLHHDLESRKTDIENLDSSLRKQSDDLRKKNLEVEKLVSQLRQHADKAKDVERSAALISEESDRCRKEAEMRMSVYQHTCEMKIQALSSAREVLQTSAAKDAEALNRFRNKYVAALADNSLLLETIKILNNSVAQMQCQISDLESKLGAKDLEISSGKACLQELIRETDSNSQLLHCAIDRHSRSIASHNSIIYEQVISLIFVFSSF